MPRYRGHADLDRLGGGSAALDVGVEAIARRIRRDRAPHDRAYSDLSTAMAVSPPGTARSSSWRPLGLRGSRPSLRSAPANSMMSRDSGALSLRRLAPLGTLALACWGVGENRPIWQANGPKSPKWGRRE